MPAYYNENDDYCVRWLRNLIARGLIAPGDVDNRSIEDVRPDDLRGYDQCHFFAGIGGWSAALRLAGWPDDRPIWTGSCPCQPFSAAGAQAGFADERHLWPAWFHLIEQCEPAVIFGEQVEAAIKHGWLDLVQTDLQGRGYAFGAAVLPAAGVGAPHIRHRVWWGAVGGFWRDAHAVYCRDGKLRPVKRGAFPLASRLPKGMVRGGDRGASFDADDCTEARTGRLKGYGNSIVPQVAAEFILATLVA